MPPEVESASPISCELCRQRKCKCDRSLPFCSQCLADPSKCNYPESGKRGLPLGYINQLERRLADTELALYGALASLRAIDSSAIVRASWKAEIFPKRKAARMQEWTQFPLREPSDLDRWLDAKKDQFTIMGDTRDAQRTMPLGEIESADSTMQRRNARRSNMPGMLTGVDSPGGARSDRRMTASSMQTDPQMSINQATSPSTPGRTPWGDTSRHCLSEQNRASPCEVIIPGEEVQMGKAGQLSKMHAAIYF